MYHIPPSYSTDIFIGICLKLLNHLGKHQLFFSSMWLYSISGSFRAFRFLSKILWLLVGSCLPPSLFSSILEKPRFSQLLAVPHKVLTTSVRKTVSGLSLLGSPSWPPANRVWRTFLKITGRSMGGTSSPGKPQPDQEQR